MHEFHTPIPHSRTLARYGRTTAMSAHEREDALDEVQRILSPESLAFLRQRIAKRTSAAPAAAAHDKEAVCEPAQPAAPAPRALSREEFLKSLAEDSAADAEEPVKLVTPLGEELSQKEVEHLPVKPDKSWLNMNVVEKDKLEWIGDLSSQQEEQKNDPRPIRKHQVGKHTQTTPT